MKKPLPADLQRWSEELAADPRSLAFLPLARAYRRQNRPDAAMRLCLRGLEHHPDNADAHGLLALLYIDRGDYARAADEWSFVLRLDPSNFDALRGLGFCHLENGELQQARERLERASLIRPDDEAVREALRFVADRMDAEDARAGSEPWMETPAPAGTAEAANDIVSAAPEPAVLPEPDPWAPAEQPAAGSAPRAGQPAVQAGSAFAVPDPARLFEAIVTGPVLGALLLDTRGMVLAGALDDVGGAADALAAVLGSVTGEAARTAAMLGLGAWEGLLIEAGSAVLHLAPAGDDAVILLVARSGAPAGWMMRSAAHAASLAQEFLEAYA
ncbi:MAG: tetratricopeptide repeat protein [Candidatus Cloacimonetes bacterium]|nr:tetratricopeptide repeat protein [Candidatus Cloacimonadota bacterium]